MIKRAGHIIRIGPAIKLVLTASLVAPVFLSGCSFQQYVAKPIDPLTTLTKFEQKDPASEQFHQYLLSNGYTADRLPVKQWGVDELTYCALFFHPSLDVARAQWRAALFAEVSAAEKTTPLSLIHI